MEEKKEWKRLSDVAIVKAETNDQMLYRYLAKDLVDRTESVDKETGETKVTAELLMQAGTYLDQVHIQKIDFYRNSGSNIEEIWICSHYYPQMKERCSHSGVYEVTMDLGWNKSVTERIQKKVVVFAGSVDMAIRISSEYVSIYTDYGKDLYSVIKIDAKDYRIDDDILEDMSENNEDLDASQRLSYYKIDADVQWTQKEFGNPSNPYKDRIEYVCDAYEVSDAREKAQKFIESSYKDQLLIDSKIVKVQPYRADIFVPREYSKIFYEDDSKK